MYIEITHDATGKIVGCWCSDTLPEGGGDNPMVRYKGGIPAGHEQVRINIDTLTEMEIEANTGMQAVIDEDTGLPVMRKIDRADYIAQNFEVNRTKAVPIPTNVKMPTGMKMRELKRN